MGLDTTDSTKSNLDVYKEFFEAPFIDATEAYYTAESEKFITENSVPEYMKKVATRLEEISRRVLMSLRLTGRDAIDRGREPCSTVSARVNS